jgi:hypothetical protein
VYHFPSCTQDIHFSPNHPRHLQSGPLDELISPADNTIRFPIHPPPGFFCACLALVTLRPVCRCLIVSNTELLYRCPSTDKSSPKDRFTASYLGTVLGEKTAGKIANPRIYSRNPLLTLPFFYLEIRRSKSEPITHSPPSSLYIHSFTSSRTALILSRFLPLRLPRHSPPHTHSFSSSSSSSSSFSSSTQ